LAAHAAQKKAATAAKLSEGRAPKMQVLRGSERLNKLSQTNAFKLAVVNKSTARSMYEVGVAISVFFVGQESAMHGTL
jgi:hypothetical protein